MRYLYVDNFRGFTDSYIPIKDVNFLVGENSTGKTSILSLIKLLGSPGFWLAQQFNTKEIELGYFKDIVSINSEDKTYFKVGAIYSDSEDTAKTEAFLMTFSKRKGLPIIHQYNYMRNQQQVKIIFSEKQIKYKVLSPDLFNQNVLKTFRGWTGENEKKGFKVINQKDILFSRTEALAHIDNFIESLLKEKNRQSDTLTIRTPGFASLVWLAPIRSKPKRTYDDYQIVFNPEGEHTPYLIKRILGQEKAKDSFLPFINEFGEESGLSDGL